MRLSHVVDHGLLEASDEKILQFALTQSAVIVSADSDFTTMLALAGLSAPSLVLLRSMDRLTPAQQASFLVSNLPAVEVELSLGAVVSISREHLRVRSLPMGKPPRPPEPSA